MKTRKGQQTTTSLPFNVDLLGSNVVLNFINTLRNDAGVPLETLQNDKDVLVWMKKMGLPEPKLRRSLPKGALLQSARGLRAATLAVIREKKAGERIHLAGLNHFLAGVVSHSQLRQLKILLNSIANFADSAEEFLGPVIEAISDLLAHGNIDLIRQCEASGCVLWFLDRSNGRRRRFCTEDACGTRTRVAAYRAKQTQRQAST